VAPAKLHQQHLKRHRSQAGGPPRLTGWHRSQLHVIEFAEVCGAIGVAPTELLGEPVG